MRKKFALFYILITSLCFLASAAIALHSLGYRVNRSSSLPSFVYRITPIGADEPIRRGDAVLIDLSRFPNPVIAEGVRRGYVNLREPMLKKVGAVPGDAVTLSGNSLSVSGETARQTVASRDSYGGELSAWPTPVTLRPGEYWLVSDPERGFDSRYFGPVRREAVTHRARPVTRPAWCSR